MGEGGVKPEYDKCIDVATTGALKELIPAGSVAVLATIAVGFIGDTVGGPFKDTAGPSINTQITVISLVASLLSYLFVQFNIFG